MTFKILHNDFFNSNFHILNVDSRRVQYFIGINLIPHLLVIFQLQSILFKRRFNQRGKFGFAVEILIFNRRSIRVCGVCIIKSH